jgi:hypothetical protein
MCVPTGTTDFTTIDTFVNLLSATEDDMFVMVGVPDTLQHDVDFRLLQCRKRRQRLQNNTSSPPIETESKVPPIQAKCDPIIITDDEEDEGTDEDEDEDEEMVTKPTTTITREEMCRRRLLFFTELNK